VPNVKVLEVFSSPIRSIVREHPSFALKISLNVMDTSRESSRYVSWIRNEFDNVGGKQ
jgi:hypothetical protein